MNPWSPRGFSNASCLLSGENTSLPTVPRIDSSRSGSRHSLDALARVSFQTLLASSDTHAARLPSGDSTAPSGGAAIAAPADASVIAHASPAPTRPLRMAPPYSPPAPPAEVAQPILSGRHGPRIGGPGRLCSH